MTPAKASSPHPEPDPAPDFAADPASDFERHPMTHPMTGRWRGIDHVQLAIPVGSEDEARSFYVGVLGLVEVPKPPALAARGGAWFEAGYTRVHVGVEADFRPARKAHPALVVERLREFVASTGLDVIWSDEIPGVDRCHVDDPFGNRIELVEAT